MAKRRILMQPRKATKRAGQKLFNESATECAVREKRERRVMATLGITLATLILLAAGFISTKAYAGAFEVTVSPARFEISGKSGQRIGQSLDIYNVAAATNASLPVTVKSNGGQVRLKATVVSTLSNGSSSIPMSQLLLHSSDATNLPAPVLPNTGDSNWVNVAPTSFAAKVTNRTANWSFAYANTVSPMAGNYSGQVLFTATIP